ncbi:uncharacterized protein LOC106370591 [Brassica napus]|uniref:uncharacterized protein LOC106417620 n=1 Tax=Brassica napus TaxID=3708 RepID=UPI0006AA774B|nr:uncharacterized protein LOC106417620 [Brassica napus]XP_048629817.1 uncharacterized protein LOC106370591 [Brassica napus]
MTAHRKRRITNSRSRNDFTINPPLKIPSVPTGLRSSNLILGNRNTIMGLTNFILTVAGVGAVVMLLKGDVKQSATVLRRNVKHIRNWLEEESSAASKAAQSAKPKEIETKVPEKDVPKDKN